jgi:hypothetical protein
LSLMMTVGAVVLCNARTGRRRKRRG